MFPCTEREHVPYGCPGNLIFFHDVFERIVFSEGPDFNYVCFGQLGFVLAFASRFQTCVIGMLVVRRVGRPFQVGSTAFRFVAVLMVHDGQVFGIWNELLCYKYVDVKCCFHVVFGQVYDEVSIFDLIRAKDSARYPVRLARFCRDGAWQTTHLSVVTDLVSVFVSGNVSPMSISFFQGFTGQL